MISLKDYAKKKNVSYEAVRKQVNRYRAELGDHLYRFERTQYLDEEGEAYLDRKRASNPVILIAHDKDAQIEELIQQNESLKIKVAELQEQVIQLQDRLLLLTAKQNEHEEVDALNNKKWWQFWK